MVDVSITYACRVKTTRLLAEGGFGYVYLVQDIRTDQQFALKKMLCQTPEHVRVMLENTKS